MARALLGRHSKNAERGMTLIELMISIVIGLLILAGVFQMYLTSTVTQRSQEGMSRLQENARYIFALMERELSQVGYVGCFNFDSERIFNDLTAESGSGQLYDFNRPLEAGNNSGYNNSDILTYRYAVNGGRIPLIARSEGYQPLVVDSDHPNYSQLQQDKVVVVSDCSRATVLTITNTPDDSGVIAHAKGSKNLTGDLGNSYGSGSDEVAGGSVAYIYAAGSGAHRFKIDTGAAGVAAGKACATEPSVCAFYKEVSGTSEELVAGVEDFQLEFGWKDGSGKMRITDATNSNLIDWDNVDRIVVTVKLNTIDAIPTSAGNTIVSKTFTKTIMLRNKVSV